MGAAVGRGVVYAHAVVHHVAAQAFKDIAPYVAALVTLDGTDERVHLPSNVVDCPWHDVTIGMPVEVASEEAAEGILLPGFHPRRTSA